MHYRTDMNPFLRLLLPLLCACGAASAADLVDRAYLQAPALEIAKDDVERDQQEGRLIEARKEHFQRFSKSLPEGAPYLRIADGVVADASNRVVYVWAWSSHMGPGEPVEFFLSSIRGGRQYESSFVTDARPSDVDAALRHIGLTPGWPFDMAGKQLWPKGDRVRVEVLRAGADGAVQAPVRIEASCTDHIKEGPAGPYSHVFVGSARVPDPADPSRMVYAADEFDPVSISSNFNLVNTVLDLPERRAKTAVYGQMTLAHPPLAKPFQNVIVTLRPDPDFPPGSIPTLRLAVGGEPGRIALSVTGPAAPVEGSLDELARLLTAAKNGARLAHLSLDLLKGNTLTVAQVASVAARLQQAEEEGLVRIDPPPAGQLYYRAWIPDPTLLERKGRTIQPWEAHLTFGAQGGAGHLVMIEETWREDAIEPDLHETRVPLDGPDALVEKARGMADAKPAVLLVFVPADTSAAAVLGFLLKVEPLFPVIYVFGGAPAAP